MTRLSLLMSALALATAGLASAQEPAPIADNSFLLEEAYNQDAGVVQHISAFLRQSGGGGWAYTFTQEWPFFGQTSQVSYSILVVRAGGVTGMGDAAINYRHQLVNSERTAVAPRLSLVVPTGEQAQGFGTGALGVQTNLPVSVRIAPSLVTHWNAGVAVTPSAKNVAGDKATTTDFNLGGSVIWLAKPTLNVLVEVVYVRSQEVIGAGATAASEELLVVPGVRWALNFPSGLQIVPGIGVPIGVGPSRGSDALFFYLSFEHPFKRS